MSAPKQGELYWVAFDDPAIGSEQQGRRPALVVSSKAVDDRFPIRIVVPLTTWREKHDRWAWCVPVEPSEDNKLSARSAADTMQVKSVSLQRFGGSLGQTTTDELRAVLAALMVSSLGIRLV